MTKQFELSEKGIMDALEFLGDELPKKKVSEKDIIKTRLLAEECLFKLEKDAPEEITFEIWIRSVLGNVTTKIKCKGKEIHVTGEKVERSDKRPVTREDILRRIYRQKSSDEMSEEEIDKILDDLI